MAVDLHQREETPVEVFVAVGVEEIHASRG